MQYRCKTYLVNEYFDKDNNSPDYTYIDEGDVFELDFIKSCLNGNVFYVLRIDDEFGEQIEIRDDIFKEFFIKVTE